MQETKNKRNVKRLIVISQKAVNKGRFIFKEMKKKTEVDD